VIKAFIDRIDKSSLSFLLSYFLILRENHHINGGFINGPK
jgi:hypothetical protein